MRRNSDAFNKENLEELKGLLGDLIDIPHRVVEEYFYRPDEFIGLLQDKEKTTLRDKFLERLELDDDDENERLMIWQEVSEVFKDKSDVIDEWTEYERRVMERWRKRFLPSSG